MNFTPHGPIHATPGGDMRPHLTASDMGGQIWHIPYHGQTTLDMYGKPNFDPRPQWQNIANNGLGTLFGPGATQG